MIQLKIIFSKEKVDHDLTSWTAEGETIIHS